jgi:hypothetical protein
VIGQYLLYYLYPADIFGNLTATHITEDFGTCSRRIRGFGSPSTGETLSEESIASIFRAEEKIKNPPARNLFTLVFLLP